jgi:transposase
MGSFSTKTEALRSIAGDIREALITYTDLSCREIAEMFDVRTSHVARLAKKLRIKRDARLGRGRDTEIQARILDRPSLAYKAIGVEFGVSESTVGRIARKSGVGRNS